MSRSWFAARCVRERSPLARAGAIVGIILAGWSAATAALADPMPPDLLVKKTADQILHLMEVESQARPGNQAKLVAMVEELVVPHFDFARMTRLAVGKSWRQASAEQQKALLEQFRLLLVRSYTTAYTAYRNHIVVDVRPLKLQPTDDDVVVRTLIRLPGGAEPIQADYSMYKSSSDWKVYDVTVGGVSLVTTYRTTFAEQIQQGGIDGLIRNLTEMNAAKAAPAQATR